MANFIYNFVKDSEGNCCSGVSCSSIVISGQDCYVCGSGESGCTYYSVIGKANQGEYAIFDYDSGNFNYIHCDTGSPLPAPIYTPHPTCDCAYDCFWTGGHLSDSGDCVIHNNIIFRSRVDGNVSEPPVEFTGNEFWTGLSECKIPFRIPCSIYWNTYKTSSSAGISRTGSIASATSENSCSTQYVWSGGMSGETPMCVPFYDGVGTGFTGVGISGCDNARPGYRDHFGSCCFYAPCDPAYSTRDWASFPYTTDMRPQAARGGLPVSGFARPWSPFLYMTWRYSVTGTDPDDPKTDTTRIIPIWQTAGWPPGKPDAFPPCDHPMRTGGSSCMEAFCYQEDFVRDNPVNPSLDPITGYLENEYVTDSCALWRSLYGDTGRAEQNRDNPGMPQGFTGQDLSGSAWEQISGRVCCSIFYKTGLDPVGSYQREVPDGGPKADDNYYSGMVWYDYSGWVDACTECSGCECGPAYPNNTQCYDDPNYLSDAWHAAPTGRDCLDGVITKQGRSTFCEGDIAAPHRIYWGPWPNQVDPYA